MRQAVALMGLACCSVAVSSADTLDATASIVISATRSEQADNRLPVSVDRLDRTTLQEGRALVNLSEVLGQIPGLVAQNRQNYAQDLQISSRGFGARASFGVRGIRLYSDGIPATMPDGQGQVSHFALGSAERLEVLRGPFSVLYGNAAGGVISLFTETGKAGMHVQPSFSLGSDDSERLGFKLSGDTGQLNYLLDVAHFTTDGYREHSAAQRDTTNARLRFATGDNATLTLVGNMLDMPNSDDALGLERSQWRQNPRQAGSNALAYNTRKSNAQQQLGAHWEWKLSPGDTAHLTAWGGQREVRQFQSILASVQAAAVHPGGVIDLDRTYAGLDGRWTHRGLWLSTPLETTVGMSYETLTERRRGYENFLGSTLGVLGRLRRDEDNRIFSRDAYVQSLWSPLPQLTVMAGLRSSEVAVRSRDDYVAPGNGDDSGRTAFAKTTPAIGLNYALAENFRLYAAWGEGFETPTGNELAYRNGAAGLNFALRPALSTHREIGIKSSPLVGTRLNLARFEIDTDDEIVVDASSGGRTSFRNGGRTRRTGWELAWHADHAHDLSSAIAFTETDARYQTSNGSIVDGNRLPGIPRYSLYGEVLWAKPEGGWNAAFEARASSRVWTNDANSEAAPGYGLINLRIGYEHQIGRLRLQEFLRIDNLADRAYVGSVIVNEARSRFYEPAPGRNYLIGISASMAL